MRSFKERRAEALQAKAEGKSMWEWTKEQTDFDDKMDSYGERIAEANENIQAAKDRSATEKGAKRSRKLARKEMRRAVSSVEIQCEGRYMAVVGESFEGRQLLILKAALGAPELEMEGAGVRIATGLEASLVPEPNNPYDANAIGVFLDSNQVGYMSKDDAAGFPWREVMTVPAEIRGSSNGPHLGVVIQVPRY